MTAATEVKKQTRAQIAKRVNELCIWLNQNKDTEKTDEQARYYSLQRNEYLRNAKLLITNKSRR